jgi:hypothetical protein
MTMKMKPEAAATSRLQIVPHAAPYDRPPWTSAERVQRIEAMGRQINDYVRSMTQAYVRGGTSEEAKHRAVAAFYDRMTSFERQLARIYEEHRLE